MVWVEIECRVYVALQYMAYKQVQTSSAKQPAGAKPLLPYYLYCCCRVAVSFRVVMKKTEQFYYVLCLPWARGCARKRKRDQEDGLV